MSDEAAVVDDHTSGRIRLPDGRRLAYAEYGDPTGSPLLYMHGSPSSRLEPLAFGLDAAARRAGVRLVAPDRPGMGGSDFLAHRQVTDWPADLAALADHLALRRFAVLGYSGGVPYAAVAAWALPNRVTRCSLVACVAHLHAGLDAGLDPRGLQVKGLARTHPGLARLLLTATMGLPARHPKALLAMLNRTLPPEDREALGTPELSVGFPATIAEAFRSGGRGPTVDLGLMTRPWTFDLAQIDVPTMLWQGRADTFGARPAMAERLHELLPRSTLRVTPGGHLSVMVDHRAEILSSSVRPD
jgi:pimeloyl-ACP methyl ester carboxylesterase